MVRVMLIACPLFFHFSCCEMTDREIVGKGDADVVRLVVIAATNGDFFVKESDRQVVGCCCCCCYGGFEEDKEGKKVNNLHYLNLQSIYMKKVKYPSLNIKGNLEMGYS